jgi:hypothetical protein
MGYLDQIKENKSKEPLFILIYGVPGIGKSTLASEFPDPLFFGDRMESEKLKVFSGPEPETMQECREALNELIAEKTLKFKTLVFDNLGWFEPLAWDEIVKKENVKSIDDIGWQNGYKMSISRHQEIILLLKELRKKHKMDIVAVGHSQVKTFQDPSIQAAYDQYKLSINDQAANVWIRSVEAVLFMNYEVLKADEKKKFAQGEGIRFMYTQERPAFKAKNRFGLPFKMVMPLGEGYKTLIEAIKKGEPESAESLLGQIGELKLMVVGEDLKAKIEKVIGDAGQDTKKLTGIKDRLIALTTGTNAGKPKGETK